MYHLGINLGHDRSVSIVKDGEIVMAVEQERLDRVKHSVGFMLQSPGSMGQIQIPSESIASCLDYLNITLDDIETITPNMPGVDYAPEIVGSKFPRDISSKVLTIPSHHLAHAYSAFFPSHFDEALVLVVDASGSTFFNELGGRTESYTLYIGSGSELTRLHRELVPSHIAAMSTLGFVYETVTRLAGFVTTFPTGLSFPEAGKLMGLSAYGGPQKNWETWFRKEPGSYHIEMSAYDIFLEIMALKKRYDTDSGKPYFRAWLVDLAYKVQVELENILCELVTHAVEETGIKKLCLAGGVALNSVANYKIFRRCSLEDIFIFPAAGDNGISAGCALWAYSQSAKKVERKSLGTACLGRSYSDFAVDAAISLYGKSIKVEKLSQKNMIERVAQSLSEGNIVARFEGGSEFGPRALGHRSIMADPAFIRMKDVVNARVKFREAFRPFAPFVPLDRANEVFELSASSPYMLLVAPVRDEFRESLPAITHEDGTGRIQTCTKDQNPFFYQLCLEVENIRGGSPVLLNTSFNVAGQPIVETPGEALETFLRTDIDFMALEDRFISKQGKLKGYAEHIVGLPDPVMPQGLPAGQQSVRELMSELDSALFKTSLSRNWSELEIKELSNLGARFKETSKLFNESPYVSNIRTQLGPHATMILDPWNGSVLVDESGSENELTLSLEQIETLLALSNKPSEVSEILRLKIGATPEELRMLIAEMIQVAEKFKIEIDADWRSEVVDETSLQIIDISEDTLGQFEDAHFDLGSDLSQLRKRFLQVGYSEDGICERLGVESLQSIEPTKLSYYDRFLLAQDGLGDLIRLFQLRASISAERLRNIFSEDEVKLMIALGLISENEDEYSGRVDIFSVDGLLIATDHRYMLKPADTLSEDPVMYIGMDSFGLVQSAPRVAVDTVLDLCCGSGVQGLAAIRYAKKVVAVDVNPRAIRFSRFNAQLNGIENYEAFQGNLYEAVLDQKFDCILANPPFVPSPTEDLKFRDGGETGENILAEIIQGANRHLNDLGRLCIVTDLVDITSYESKLSSWWGDSPFLGLILTTADRDEILFSVPHCHAPFSQSLVDFDNELERWVNNFRKAKLTAVNFGYINVWKDSKFSNVEVMKRTIHNPTKPIFAQVNDWVEQIRMWHGEGSRNLILGLHPDLKFEVEQHIDGTPLSCTVRFPGNQFFTEYSITNEMREELLKIYQTEPPRSQRSRSSDTWVEELHRLGIIRLNTRRRSYARKIDPSAGEDKVRIEQRETKTTPTCLSSYLG